MIITHKKISGTPKMHYHKIPSLLKKLEKLKKNTLIFSKLEANTVFSNILKSNASGTWCSHYHYCKTSCIKS